MLGLRHSKRRAVGRIFILKSHCDRRQGSLGIGDIQIQQMLWPVLIKILGNIRRLFLGTLQERVQRPVQRRFAGAIGTVGQQVAPIQLEIKVFEGFERLGLNALNPKCARTAPSR